MKFTWIIHTYFAITGLFFREVSVISNALLPTLNKTLYNNAVKFPASTSEHITKTGSIRCHLQNGTHAVHVLQSQTSGSRRVTDLGCEQDGEEQSIPFFRLPHVCAS
jgi:hypothetical protein